jgi:hypothetical protein
VFLTAPTRKEIDMRNSQNSAMCSAEDADLDAFNAAFDELGFEWRWNHATMAELAAIAGDKERVCAYVRRHHPHLFKVYDAEFLGALIVDTKRRRAQGEASGRHAAVQHDARA